MMARQGLGVERRPRFHPHTDGRKRHPTLRPTAGEHSFIRHCAARLDLFVAQCLRVSSDEEQRCSSPRQRWDYWPGGELDEQP